MKLLGVDYGAKRIGLAVSDEGAKFAFPKRVIDNNILALEEIGKIIKGDKIFEIVMGDSVNADGSPNAIAGEIEDFSRKLGTTFNLPVRKEKEFFTSVEARRYAEGGGRVDASAAALILQRYLDRRNKSEEQ